MTRRLLVIGIDAGGDAALRELAAEGRLPALAGLMERGATAPLRGPELLCEHGIWVSLLTGVDRGRHGFYSYRQLVPGTYDLEEVDGRDAAARPFWAGLAEERRVISLDVPQMPPDPALPATQLGDWAVHNPLRPPSAVPASLLAEADREVGPSDPIPEDLDAPTADDDRRIYERLLARVERKGALARHLLAREDWEIGIVVFADGHTGGHQLWRHHRRHADGDPALADAYPTLLAAVDAELGRVVDAAGPETDVVVVSSIGIADHYPLSGMLPQLCRDLGYQARPAGRASRRPIDLVRRVLPERVRERLSARLPRERREALLADAFRSGTDWSRTTAFAIPSTYTGFLRVNLRGREPQGTVAPERYREVLDALAADVEALRTAEGEPIVERVVRTADVWHGGEPPRTLPDLLVMWREHDSFVTRLDHPRTRLEQGRPDFFRGSDHLRDGIVVAAGPSFAAGAYDEAVDPLDLAPTLLRVLGEPIPDGLSGRPMPLLAPGRPPAPGSAVEA